MIADERGLLDHLYPGQPGQYPDERALRPTATRKIQVRRLRFECSARCLALLPDEPERISAGSGSRACRFRNVIPDHRTMPLAVAQTTLGRSGPGTPGPQPATVVDTPTGAASEATCVVSMSALPAGSLIANPMTRVYPMPIVMQLAIHVAVSGS